MAGHSMSMAGASAAGGGGSARETFQRLVAQWGSMSVPDLQAAGYPVFEDVARYAKNGEWVAHLHNTDPSKPEVMLEIRDGKPGRVVGVMLPGAAEVDAGQSHKHGEHSVQHVWFSKWDNASRSAQPIDISTQAGLDMAFDKLPNGSQMSTEKQ
jgi:hypothetical protein